jgi:hypothetical protein
LLLWHSLTTQVVKFTKTFTEVNRSKLARLVAVLMGLSASPIVEL